jgi:EmrB/QacA subfamily drug resistance transporter
MLVAKDPSVPSPPSTAHPPRERLDPQVWRIAGVVLLGPLMTSLDSTVVNISLARLGREMNVPLTTIQWVTSGYLLALALMLPLSGWLVDRVGAKRVYLGCFTAFTLASMLCGGAGSSRALVGFRVLQGMAGGLLAPMAQMMTARSAGRYVARVMGVMVVPILIGPILGPVLAGFILQHASWRWIFFINLPVGILAVLLAALILPRDTGETRPRPFDLGGFLLASPGLVLLLHSLDCLSEAPGRIICQLELAAALGLLAGFLRHALRRGPAALVDLGLFRGSAFSRAAATQFLVNAIAFGGQMLLPLYLLTVRQEGAARAGMLLIPAGLGMMCTFPMMGPLTERFGSRRVASAGALAALAGTLPFAWAGFAGGPAWAVGLAIFVRGAGLGCIGLPSIAVAYAAIPRETIPVATTAINLVQRLGGPAATTALAIFLHARMTAVPEGSGLWLAQGQAHAFAATFGVLCAIHLACVLAALRLPLWAEHDRPGPGSGAAIE